MNRSRILMCAVMNLALLVPAATSRGVSIQAFFEDFNGFTPASGAGVPDPLVSEPDILFDTTTDGLKEILDAGATLDGLGFSGNLLARGDGGVDRITLTNLPEHTSFDLNLLFVAGNSLDAERFQIDVSNVDNTGLNSLFDVPFGNDGSGATFNPVSFPGGSVDTGVLLSSGSDVLAGLDHSGSNDNDIVFNLGLQDEFDGIAHTADTLVVEFSYLTDQDLANEFFAIENIEIILNGVPESALLTIPEPGTWSLLLIGGLFLGVRRRTRRSRR